MITKKQILRRVIPDKSFFSYANMRRSSVLQKTNMIYAINNSSNIGDHNLILACIISNWKSTKDQVIDAVNRISPKYHSEVLYSRSDFPVECLLKIYNDNVDFFLEMFYPLFHAQFHYRELPKHIIDEIDLYMANKENDDDFYRHEYEF